ncbi:MAG: hypothetical protein ACR2PA_18405 [Hyphomicrobiaceae bacterium]
MSEPYFVTAVEAELARRRRDALRIAGVVLAGVVAVVVGLFVLG